MTNSTRYNDSIVKVCKIEIGAVEWFTKRAFCSTIGIGSSNGIVSSSFQAQSKHKESNCLLLSGNVVEASNLLESSIPIRSPFHTYAISMDLGRMYTDLGRVHDARRCFIDVLNKNVYALEAIECLTRLGSEKSAVSKIIKQKLSNLQQQQQQQQQAATDKAGDSNVLFVVE
eukprot:CAMPEP_0203640064 /NCGR_PEP_ID=MMETSP0088-20131115/5647_1 /ASSEMBLY_ACC=CAM_ASM_001087 /TAXON_ID=426623 /ORGANISM="Chaetoceros affinis, Strain CCMP159" /LENGTH=171 /DNA_ID=CAMNT_0050495127 /DNA_START=243 /DNA_END=758 /DNA_ORIENTATION=+